MQYEYINLYYNNYKFSIFVWKKGLDMTLVCTPKIYILEVWLPM